MSSTTTITREADTASSSESSSNAPDQQTNCCSPDGSPMPAPTPEHQWLQRFVGEWDSQVEIFMSPDQPPMLTTGTETARMLGGFWLISEGSSHTMSFSFLLKLGYDPTKAKYIASWVDSMTSFAWIYEGTVDPSGDILTLNTEGPFPPPSGPLTKIKEVAEFKSNDHRIFTSSRLTPEGKWALNCRVDCRRKK